MTLARNSWFILLLTLSCSSPISEVESEFSQLPGMSITRINSANSSVPVYRLQLRQPIDHEHPEGGHFYQHAILTHKAPEQPIVINTHGYDIDEDWYSYLQSGKLSPLASMVSGNQLFVEHRYFGESQPEEIDWKYLNFKQITADLHRWREILSRVYEGPWISTGGSKGGVTATLYRYFYPDDVQATVPIAAPMMLSFEDERVFQFLDTVGSHECRSRIRSFQLALFENRDRLIPLFQSRAKEAKEEFSTMSMEQALEYSILEYPFAHWMYGVSCEDSPSDSATAEGFIDHLLAAVRTLEYYSDRGLAKTGPYIYQSATELGSWNYSNDEFEEFVDPSTTSPNSWITYLPDSVEAQYDNTLFRKVLDWLNVGGDRFIHIYRGSDPWSAFSVAPPKDLDALWYMLPERHHHSLGVYALDEMQKEEVRRTLQRWLEV
ncbi:MAG: S28 family serine protease, partial [Bacteroidota bacterium]